MQTDFKGLGNSMMLNASHIQASKSNYQVAPSVGVILFALPVGDVSIWPMGRSIPCLPVDISGHILHIVLYIWSVGVSLTQRNNAWALTLLS